MQLLELYADAGGETHFRSNDVPLEERAFAPPARPVLVSPPLESTTSVFLIAPPGWDDTFHPTPRRQLAVLLEGEATMTATDGTSVSLAAGDVILLSDAASRGHLTRAQGSRNVHFLLIGLTP